MSQTPNTPKPTGDPNTEPLPTRLPETKPDEDGFHVRKLGTGPEPKKDGEEGGEGGNSGGGKK